MQTTRHPEPFATLPAPWAPDAVGIAGLRLEWLRLTVDPDGAAAAIRDQIHLLSALHGHRGVRFVLQYLADPSAARADEQFRVDLLAVAPVDEHGPDPSELGQLVGDLDDLLCGHDRWYRFAPISAAEEISRVIRPFEAASAAEVLRREEPVGAAVSRRGLGFGADLDERRIDQLWTYSAFHLVPDSRRRLIELMLLQEAPVLVRVTLTPTVVTDEERLELGALQRRWTTGTSDDIGAPREPLHAMALVAPSFETQIVVAGRERLSPAFVESVGLAVSPPRPPESGGGPLTGGYTLEHLEPSTVITDTLRPSANSPERTGLAPVTLHRLRRVMGPWEAAAAFRIPVATEASFPGLPVNRTPSVTDAGRRLPTTGLMIGEVQTPAESTPIRLSGTDRFRHIYVLGQTGTGKSTLLQNLIVQDIRVGEGVAVLDPHGDLVESLLGCIPEERLDDVVLVDPADPHGVVGINLLEAESDIQANYLLADLCLFFQQLYDPQNQGIVGPRFQTWLRNACATLLPVPDQGTICDVPRLFIDDAYLKYCFQYLRDPLVRDFWIEEMGKTSDYHKSEMLGWFNSKFDAFRGNRMMRSVLAQPRSTINFQSVMDERKILLVKLSKGLMGETNAALMGYVVFAKLWAAALGRAAQPEAERQPFHIYADEFQNVTSPTLPAILSEARKFKVSLTMANQFFSQLTPQLRESVTGNVGSKMLFRLGATDARDIAASQGGNTITEDHLRRLPNFLMVANLLVKGEPLDPMLVSGLPPQVSCEVRAKEARRRSQDRYALDRPVVERLLDHLHSDYADDATALLVKATHTGHRLAV